MATGITCTSTAAADYAMSRRTRIHDQVIIGTHGKLRDWMQASKAICCWNHMHGCGAALLWRSMPGCSPFQLLPLGRLPALSTLWCRQAHPWHWGVALPLR